MSDHSKIEWTDATWNPVRGCSKVSPGCANCYAIRDAHRFAGVGMPYQFLTKTEPLNWTGVIRTVPEQLDKPLAWKRPRRIFVNSMSDLFHESVPVDFIAEVFAVMWLADHHIFQVLTKRAERMRSLLTDEMFRSRVILEIGARAGVLHSQGERDQALAQVDKFNARPDDWWPLKNVWLGVSVENQDYADARIPELLKTPAAVRFLSMEPLLGPVNLGRWIHPFEISRDEEGNDLGSASGGSDLDWVIVGGESGPEARWTRASWVRSIRDICLTCEVPFFFKQWGEWAPGGQTKTPHRTGLPIRWIGPDGYRAPQGMHNDDSTEVIFRFGKKDAGRLLDGREWNEIPPPANELLGADLRLDVP